MILNNGVELPALGLGVFQTSPAETVPAVEAALDSRGVTVVLNLFDNRAFDI